MAQASNSNYEDAMEKYDSLVKQYYGAENYGNLYNQSAEIASKNAQTVQQDKYNSYISQGMNPAKAARMASQDATSNYTTEKNNLVSNLYNANKDVVNAQTEDLNLAKTQDDTSNQNKGRVWSTVGGVLSGAANALGSGTSA